ncbi:MAG: NAD kinase [Tannerellaceae bacterium]|nr:NAD kinase [Tannerellaceae bacterium]
MKIGIFGSEYQDNKQIIIRRIFDLLLAHEADIYVDRSFYEYLTNKLLFSPPVHGIIDGDDFQVDVVLSLGGDGTFLRSVARINKQEIPILGINTGRLGFLADIGHNEIEDTLAELFKNYYRIEERTQLRLVTSQHRYKGYNYALNEVAILKQDSSSMITIHTSIDEQYLASYQADGLIIATPTGSTAYSLSVNGPIITPQSTSLVITPVAPHSLNMRPLVIPDKSILTLDIESRNDFFLVALDGRSEVFPANISLTVSKAEHTTRVIKRHGHTFYKTLRDKLMWGADIRES